MTDITDYLDVANAYGPALSPTADRLAYLSDRTGTLQVWLASGPTDRRQLTAADVPTGFVSWSPTGSDLVLGRSPGRSERQNLFRLHLPSEEVTALTERPDAMHRWGGWAPDGERFAFLTNRRDASAFDVFVGSLDGTVECIHRTDSWHDGAGWAPGGDRLLLVGGTSRFDKELFVLDVADGSRRRVTPFEDSCHLSSINWGPGGEAVYLVTDHGADTRYVARLDLETSRVESVVDGGDWSIEGVTLDTETGRLLYGRNVGGYTEVTAARLDGETTLTETHRIEMPDSVMGDAALAPGGRHAAVTATNRTTPPNVFVVDTETGETQQWTDAGTLPSTAFVEPDPVEFESHDGLTVPGWLSVPEVGSPPYPAVVDLHGGPEDQRRPSLLPTRQYFVAAGYVLFEPNVRGSTGYGREYASLDDRRRRLDAVDDVRAGAEWLRSRSAVDEDRLGVLGSSYGGYLALMTLTRHADLWAAGVELAGITDLRTYLETTAAWRRPLRIEEYGDPEADSEFLRAASPVASLDCLDAPLLAIHGSEDPRVPVSEVEQLGESVPTDADAETLIFEGEGHSITDPDNERAAYSRIASFFDRHL